MPVEEEETLRPPSPPVDPKVARLVERLIDYPLDDDNHSEADDDDELVEELEKELESDMDLSGFREKRMEELKREMAKIRDMRESEHGKYTEVFEEKEVVKICANQERCIVHFYHRNFQRCQIMDKHLEEIAPKYFSTRFIRVFVENVPWLVEKLSIKVLPCVICFVKGVSKDRITGFEELGNQDTFKTSTLELRLSASGVLERRTASGIPSSGIGISKIREKMTDEDDLFDLDE